MSKEQTGQLLIDSSSWWSLEGDGLRAFVEPMDRHGRDWAVTMTASPEDGSLPVSIVDEVRLKSATGRAGFLGSHRGQLNGLHGSAERLLDALACNPVRELREPAELARDGIGAAPAPFEVLDFEGLMAASSEEIQWVVEPFLRPGRVSFLFGQANAGKTWIAYDLALAVALGDAWLERHPVTQGEVLIVQEDDDLRLTQNRLGMLARGRGIDEKPSIHTAVQQGLRADSPSSWRRLGSHVEKHEYGLVVIDALGNIHGQEENEASSMKRVMDSLDALAKLGPAVLVVHHQRKGQGAPSDQMRGSSLIRDRADSSLQVTRTDSGFKVTPDKVKAAAKPAPFAIRFQHTDTRALLEYDGESSPPARKCDEAAALIKGVLKGRAEDASLTTAEIQAQISGVGDRNLKEALKRLREAEEIACSGTQYTGYSYWDPACGDSTVPDEAAASATDDAPTATFVSQQEGGQQ